MDGEECVSQLFDCFLKQREPEDIQRNNVALFGESEKKLLNTMDKDLMLGTFRINCLLALEYLINIRLLRV